METTAGTGLRRVYLTREGAVLRLAFGYNPTLVERVRQLPYASFQPDSKTWTMPLTGQAVDALRRWHHEGLTDVSIDTLIQPGETIAAATPAVLRRGNTKRPWFVHLAGRDDNIFTRLRALPGAQWEKKAQALSYPPHAAAAIADLVDRGVISDPDNLLSPAQVSVVYDGRTGTFSVRGDKRATQAFTSHYPKVDVVAAWKDKGLDVEFLDDFTEQMYRGELARHNPSQGPEGLLLDLYPYQLRNYSIAVQRDGFAVLDEPGLGKTATGIAVGFQLLATSKVNKVVVLVPAAVRTQWAREITRFTGHDDIAIVRGSVKDRQAAYLAGQTSRWLIVHYDVLGRDLESLRPLFAGALVIADEAHRLKSPDAARTKAARELCKSATRRLALSGTPVETNPGEWYEILSGWAVPGCLGSSFEFNERYRWKNNWGGYEGARNIPELRDRSKPFYGRHIKADVATHLPPLRVQHVMLDPEPAYAAALKRAHSDAAEEIKKAVTLRVTGKMARGSGEDLVLLDQTMFDEAVQGAEMTATGLLRLLCSSPRIVRNSDSESASAMMDAGLIPDVDGPKIDELRTMAGALKVSQERRKAGMAEAGIEVATPDMVHGERMVIFTFSKRMAKLIAERFTEDGVSHVLYTGDTSSDDRDKAVAAFTDPNSDVIAFIATDAGAEGLNLGRCCSLLVNADLAWTASRMAQRAQRIHRIDGTAPRYLVMNLTIAGTIEAGILALLEQRADLSDALFGETGARQQTTGRGRRASKSLIEQAFEHYKTTSRPAGKASGKATGKAASEAASDAGGSESSTEVAATSVAQAVAEPLAEPARKASALNGTSRSAASSKAGSAGSAGRADKTDMSALEAAAANQDDPAAARDLNVELEACISRHPASGPAPQRLHASSKATAARRRTPKNSKPVPPPLTPEDLVPVPRKRRGNPIDPDSQLTLL